MILEYKDTATFVTVSSNGYANSKVIEGQFSVPCIFLQSTGFVHGNNQDAITADAICYPDPTNYFVLENFYRLEGMYIIEPLYDGSDDESWYKIENVYVNRDHLLDNIIDNVQLLLKKTEKINGVS